MPLTHGSLFSGIGGFDLGFERVGFRTVWQVEIDPFCQAVLAKHFPNAKRFADVRDCGAHNLTPVTVITGGFPCQPFSVAGKRRGTADDRHLWPEMRRVIAEVRPRWVVCENVPGIFQMALKEVLFDLEAEGYDVPRDLEDRPVVYGIPACAVDASHRRERIWIVANAVGRGCGTTGVSRGVEEVRGRGADEPMSITESGADVADTRYAPGRSSDAPYYRGQEKYVLRQRKESPTQSRNSGQLERCDWWTTEPNVGRVAYGIPHRVDRIKCLGNAIVPQIAEELGRMIVQADASRPVLGNVRSR